MNNDYQREKGMSAFVAGFFGAIIGATGAVVAIFLSNRENREILKERAEDIKKRSDKALNELRSRTGEMREEAENKLEEGKEEMRQKTKGRE